MHNTCVFTIDYIIVFTIVNTFVIASVCTDVMAAVLWPVWAVKMIMCNLLFWCAEYKIQ